MPDISLRFDKDMLVLSTSIDFELKAQGFTKPGDREYVGLCEPELIEDVYNLEQVLETPVFVTATEGITRARLAYSRFEHNASDMARIAYETAAPFQPQHLLAAVGPTGLPLDHTSQTSLKQSKQQYQDAVSVLTKHPFDGVYFTGFKNSYDIQCALMGARAVYDGPIFVSLVPGYDAIMADGRTLGAAVEMCDEYGASVIGISTDAPRELVWSWARIVREHTSRPVMAELVVKRLDASQFEPTDENPYPRADDMVDVALDLAREGVQFLRAAGNATPAYTGALLAAVGGTDVRKDAIEQLTKGVQ